MENDTVKILERLAETKEKILQEISKVIVGQKKL